MIPLIIPRIHIHFSSYKLLSQHHLFHQICRPSVNCTEVAWQNRYIQSFEYHCTGSQTDKFEDMRKSFLSGHSAWSAYTMIYLAVSIEFT